MRSAASDRTENGVLFGMKNRIYETETENTVRREGLLCLRCGNTDPDLFGDDHGLHYCRKCLEFGRLPAGVPPRSCRLSRKVWKGTPHLEFELTPLQKQASARALQVIQDGRDCLIFAAAGAGKTEIVLESICWALSLGKKVGFAISRRQVVLEIAGRLQKNFPELSVIAVCEGHTDRTDADLIVCTTHQLYRYPGCFDLLILDELDAFPYAGNAVLENIARSSCRGSRLLLSATPDEHSLQAVEEGKMEIVQLFSRPHGKPLCVPRVVYAGWLRHLVCSLQLLHRWIRQEHKQVLFYVPRKRDGRKMQWFLSLFFKTGWICSESRDKDRVMDTFRARGTEVLVCTTLLERGITVPSVQVIVWQADHAVFTMASLIQIFGRVGRSIRDPQGEGVCLCRKKSASVLQCIRQLEWMNQSACAA